ncbi:helix-turn-helix domain-containing protein [Cereibacter johrii]|uniref:helix-turn-helix domain-containing protein n=1 Tax=Cereibacter johrii TaxID=445629 RepID=UPI000D3A2635
MSDARPFTPDMLADRWGCSAETVRQLVKSGRLSGFRVGRMIRIPARSVEDYECASIGSAASTGGSSSHGGRMEPEGAIVLTHARERKPRSRR